MGYIHPRLLISDTPLPDEYVEHIHCGDYILLHNYKQNLWIQIVNIKPRGYFDGIINTRMEGTRYGLGDIIVCHRRHIHSHIAYSENNEI